MSEHFEDIFLEPFGKDLKEKCSSEPKFDVKYFGSCCYRILFHEYHRSRFNFSDVSIMNQLTKTYLQKTN